MTWSPTNDPPDGSTTTPGRQIFTGVFGNDWQPDTAYERIEQGLPTTHLTTLLNTFDRETVLDALDISRRTYERRRQQGRLTPEESDRLYRLVSLLSLAADVLGSPEAAREWMTQPAVALGDRTPLAYARNEAGAQRVETLLNRIEYGVYG